MTERLGVFFKYDDTEIQTRANDIKQSASLGIYHKHAFGRESDVFGLGVAHVKSDVGGDFEEWGSEAFYRNNVTHWLKASLNLQVIEPAKAPDTIVNLGARLQVSL